VQHLSAQLEQQGERQHADNGMQHTSTAKDFVTAVSKAKNDRYDGDKGKQVWTSSVPQLHTEF